MNDSTVDEYLASFPEDARSILEQVRASILRSIPDATERISYGIVKVESEGHHAIFFGGWKKHVGLYPIPILPPELEAEVAPYRSTGHTLHFPYDSELPYELISRVVAAMA
jgi:uncharacterized protein YdhG (YjbR/CyaY superfamily)